ncbi:MAG: AraC family transcriptional regulator [Subdoligranulum sp.]
MPAILGFSSSSYFCKTFSNTEGTSPTEYRESKPGEILTFVFV